MREIKITLPDNTVKTYPSGTTGLMIAQSISEGLARNALAVEVNGEIWDLSRPIDADVSIRIFTWNDKGGKYAFWHSSAHLFAEALESIYPGVKFGIGPPIGCVRNTAARCDREIDHHVGDRPLGIGDPNDDRLGQAGSGDPGLVAPRDQGDGGGGPDCRGLGLGAAGAAGPGGGTNSNGGGDTPGGSGHSLQGLGSRKLAPSCVPRQPRVPAVTRVRRAVHARGWMWLTWSKVRRKVLPLGSSLG